MKYTVPLYVLLAVFQSGCPYSQKPSAAPKQPLRGPQTPTHRFVLTVNINLAFDTQTGQLCRTWDWKPLGKQAKPTTEGVTPQISPGQYTPTCLSLYQELPASENGKVIPWKGLKSPHANSADPLGLFDENEKPR